MSTRILSHCVCVVGLLLLPTVAWAQTTYYVNGSCGENAWTGTSPVCAAPDGPKATIQAAINATSNGDVVFVADGVYTGLGNKSLSYSGRLITVRSANGPDKCIIDCQGSGRAFRFVNGETTESVIQGFTITNGFADFGGGFFSENAGASVLDCVFISNSAWIIGGAIYHNEEGDLILDNCTFIANVGTSAVGGVFSVDNNVTLSDCVFLENVGGSTIGGLAVGFGEASLTNCSFFQNDGAFVGGGILNGGDITLVNCAFSGNTATNGGGLETDGIATLINCTFGNNAGNGVEIDDGSAVLANCVLWGNLPAQLEGGSFTVTYSDIQDGWPGTGNIDADPLFAQPGADDLRLGFGSPCIDAGDNDAVPDGITTDLDGLPRFVDDPDVPDTGNGTPPIVDMGAYEGGNLFNDPTDSEDDLDQGQTVILIPNGGSFDPFFNSAVIVTNTSGPDDAMFSVTQIDWDLHPGAAGFSELGFILRTETTLKPGQFLMRLFIPFEAEQLQGRDHARLDVTSFDDPSGNWVLGVLPNTQDSPDRHGPIGDKFVDDNPGDGWDITLQLGDWGVVYDPDLERGFMWANVDYSDDLGFGVPLCPADCSPFGGDGLVSSLDLLGVLIGWGLTGASGPCDLDRDDDVDAADLTFLLQSWGSCPELGSYSPPTIDQAGVIAHRSDHFRGRLFRGRGDLDGNGTVDRLDLHLLHANWGACDNCLSDLDADGVVGSRDLLILLANWGYSDL
ncbi:MAG: choice-of-anchor Q domain-containing protein [Phycisphaerales bacterium]